MKMESPAKEIIEREFERLREKLLDLTMRNQLLNFRPRSRTIEVVNHDPSHIYGYLVLNERKMKFAPRPEAPEDCGEEELWEYPSSEEDADGIPQEEGHQAHHQPDDNVLQTDLTGSELQRRLFYINQRARTMIQEQGYNILYLALGFLEWRTPDEPDIRKAPLILVPVLLERRRAGSTFTVKWDGSEIITNMSLQARLREEGVELPEFRMPSDIEGVKGYLEDVESSVESMEGWCVTDDVQLGFFSFTKFLMYMDLDPSSYSNWDEIIERPLLRSLFSLEIDRDENEVNIDEIPYRDLYHVVDADSSQIAVIEDVKAGKNLVVEGPPGTGKSQTIVNLIAELMAAGKTVLFVSEKMAALEVVKSRLDSIGLGRFCLELHSHKARKKDVLNELESTLMDAEAERVEAEREFRRIEKLRDELNEYRRALHEPLYGIGLSPFQLFGMKEKAERHFDELPFVRIPSPETITPDEWDEALIELQNLAKLAELLPPLPENPWSGTDPGMILPSDVRELEILFDSVVRTVDELLGALDVFQEKYGFKRVRTSGELRILEEIASVVADSRPFDLEVLRTELWDRYRADAFTLLDKLEDYTRKRAVLDGFHESVHEADIESLLREYLNESSSRIKFLSGRYRKVKNQIDALYIGKAPENDYEIIEDLETLIDVLKLREELERYGEVAEKFFGSMWQPENPRIDDLRATAEWIVRFRDLHSEGLITERTLEAISEGIERDELLGELEEIRGIHERLQEKLERLQSAINTHAHVIFNMDPDDVPFTRWKTIIGEWEDKISILPLWSQYLEKKRLCMKTRGAAFIPLIESGIIGLEDIRPAMEGNLADALLEKAFREIPVLYTFIGDLHEARIREFRELDSRIIELNRKRLIYKLTRSMPGVFGGAAPDSEESILSGEFTRKRGHMPLRKLLKRAGGVIKRIKPCFMMSPLSIAQYLDPRSSELQFDVVIFDEASQVKPEDALGAFLRARTAVVMGDTNQLPPTSFFDQMVSSEEDSEDVASAADIESILHLCKRSFPVRMLMWHYRSRHESLIAVSNQEFYDNRLLAYPSPARDDEELGLHLRYLPETVYERGRTSSNPMEASAVVDAIEEHFMRYGNTRSLGVGTFSVAQMNAILEALEARLRENPELERIINGEMEEPFFIKNLETIQGDERDVIFISIGYGFDENGRISLNFGPLNQDGGERRLNVLITRAREKCVVFTNFRSSDLKTGPGTPFGVRALKRFLRYAETRVLESDESYADAQGLFEDSVYEFLTEEGLEVDRGVGCAGFRVDFAIRDPDDDGRYIAGILTDGEMYSRSSVARDRDRLREEILRNLGWNIVHLWSSDWYRNPEETRRKLRGTIEEIITVERKARTPDDQDLIQEEAHEDEAREETMDMEAEGGVVQNDESDHEGSVSQDDPEAGAVRPSMDDGVTGYMEYTTDKLREPDDLYRSSTPAISSIVSEIVAMEAPVHVEEVIRRIRESCGLRRAGRRVRSIIGSAIEMAENNGNIKREGDFLFLRESTPITVRKRTGRIDINLISPAEIEEAVKMALKSPLTVDELTVRVARMFGFRNTSRKTSAGIRRVIDDMLARGDLVMEGDTVRKGG
ncbi:superfamily I DNA and/or RNA helicase [Methanothermobacter sp. DSM 3267]